MHFKTMKRRVIQIGNSTQLISLPRKWAQQFGVKKGDEILLRKRVQAWFSLWRVWLPLRP